MDVGNVNMNLPLATPSTPPYWPRPRAIGGARASGRGGVVHALAAAATTCGNGGNNAWP